MGVKYNDLLIFHVINEISDNIEVEKE